MRSAVLLAIAIAFGAHAAPVEEIARGQSWVSPYWGYSSPKIVFDGSVWYTTGLWGMDPAQSEGMVYQNDGSGWKEAARLPEMYQPAVLALDPQGRLIVAYNRIDKPLVLKRAARPGDATELEDLPPPPGEPEGYYLGLATRASLLYFAWIEDTDYTMYLTRLELDTLRWGEPVVVQAGQVQRKPKTAWTYPILYPDEGGLHLVATNCPDGGESNTYNQVWYLYYPNDSGDASRRELVAEGAVGDITYATDMVACADGTIHVVYMHNVHKYGEHSPVNEHPAGTYHAWRDPGTGKWTAARLCDTTIAAFAEEDDGLSVVTVGEGTLQHRRWRAEAHEWAAKAPLCASADLPANPGFFDVLTRASGSRMTGRPAVVADGLLPSDTEPQTRVLWAVLPPP